MKLPSFSANPYSVIIDCLDESLTKPTLGAKCRAVLASRRLFWLERQASDLTSRRGMSRRTRRERRL